MRYRFLLMILICVSNFGFALAQDCQGYEQKAFDFFIMHAQKDSDLRTLKFLLEDSLINKYSQFNSSHCFRTSYNSNDVELSIFNGVRIAAIVSNEDTHKNPSYCNFVKFPDSLRHLFSYNKHRHEIKKRLLQILRATKFKENYYVEFKIIGSETILFFIVEIDENKNIKRWFEQSIVF